MEVQCKHDRIPSITTVMDHTQLHAKTAWHYT